MEVTITKTKRDETKTQEEVKCVLYDARSNPKHDIDAEMKLKISVKQINPQMALAFMERDDSSLNSCWRPNLKSGRFILLLSVDRY